MGDNINMDFQEVGWAVMDWIDVPQDKDRRRAFVYEVMNIWVPSNVGNFSTS